MDIDQTRSLTYSEMAATMTITVASAKNLTRRKRWARSAGNDGLVRVLVPLDYLGGDKSAEGHHDGPQESRAESPAEGRQDALGAIAALERHVARLEASLGAAETALAEALTEVAETHAKALAEAVTTAALRATVEAVSAERDCLEDQVKAALARPASVPSVVTLPPRAWRWPFRRHA
jgi:hypothetical protein